MILNLDSSVVFTTLQGAAVMLFVMTSVGAPGFIRRMPANGRVALWALALIGNGVFVLLRSVTAERPFSHWSHWLLAILVFCFAVALPWGWRRQRLHFELQAKARDRSFWPWIFLAGIPIGAASLFALHSIQTDLNAAEQRSRDDAETMAATALARWNSEAESRFSRFFAAVEKFRASGSVEPGFNRPDLVGNPGRIEFFTNAPPAPEPVLEADWFTALPSEVRAAWTASEQHAASLPSAGASAEYWNQTARRLARSRLRGPAELAGLRAAIAVGAVTNAYESLLTFRENNTGTSPAGIPMAHLVWRELFRLPVQSGDATRLSSMFRQDAALEPPTLIPPLLDELERTWAAADPTWKETVARLHSDWPDIMRRRALENRVRSIIARALPPATLLQHAGDSYMLLTRGPLPSPPPLARERYSILIPLPLWNEAVAAVIAPTNTRSSRYFDVRLRLGELTVPVATNHVLPSELRPIVVAPPVDDSNPALVRAEVFLTDRTGFFAGVRRRAFLSSMLVLAAAGAALLGVAQARRSYIRQEDLNEAQVNFVSSVSHELRAPLASVRLLAENLERGGADDSPERRHEYYRLMVRECRRLGTLVQNVLDWSRIERGGRQYDFAPADLAALARETARLMEPQFAGRNVRLDLRIASDAQTPDSLEAVADASAIQQALINLLDNALKHSPAGSAVSLSLARNDELLQLTVADQGPGIPLDEQERIFDRFHRLGSELRRETPGVGIGLSIVKHIVESHGGRVHVESKPGSGATFTVEIPAGT